MRTSSSIEDKNESWNCSVSGDGFENQIQNPKNNQILFIIMEEKENQSQNSHNICSFMHNQNSIIWLSKLSLVDSL